MTIQGIKDKFLELKSVKEDIEKDYNTFYDAYQHLSFIDYQYRMLNAMHTYEEIKGIDASERVNYNDGEILFYKVYGREGLENEDVSLLYTIRLLNKDSDLDDPYYYLGVVQAYRTMKKLNLEEERTRGEVLKYLS